MNRYVKMMENMPIPDYSYVVPPDFVISKESSENKLTELYDAEVVKIGASAIHSYDKETNVQIEEDYWLKTVILNSAQGVDLQNEDEAEDYAKDIAETVLSEVINDSEYEKIEIVLMQQWNDGNEKSFKRSVFLNVPALTVIRE
jgi:hypothetical protein